VNAGNEPLGSVQRGEFRYCVLLKGCSMELVVWLVRCNMLTNFTF
jgi:hypothetical protein